MGGDRAVTAGVGATAGPGPGSGVVSAGLGLLRFFSFSRISTMVRSTWRRWTAFSRSLSSTDSSAMNFS